MVISRLSSGWLSVLFCLLLISQPSYSDNSTSVLLLLAYEPTYPTATILIDSISHALEHELANVPYHLSVEYLDTDLGSNTQYLAAKSALLKNKQEHGFHFDIVIAAGNGALQFALNERRELFQHSALTFISISEPSLIESLPAHAAISGVVNLPPMHETLDLIRKLYPTSRDLYVIDEQLPHRQSWREQLNQAAAQHKFQIQPLDLSQLSWDELGQKLAQLKQQPIFLLSAFYDKHENKKGFYQGIHFLREHSASPVWYPWQIGIGQGLLGGTATELKQSAEIIAQMVNRIIHGENISTLPIIWQPPLINIIDAELAQEFGFNLSQFPSSTRFINSPISFWHQYGAFIIITISVLTVICLLVYLAWRETLKRRDVARKLANSNRFIRTLLDAMPDLVFYKDTRGVYQYSNQRFNYFARGNPVGQSDFDIFNEPQAEQFKQQDLETAARNHLHILEEWLTMPDGQTLLFETRKTPIYDDNRVLLGILGLSRDITEVKRNQQSLEFIAHHDALTGLLNRYAFNHKLDYILKSSHRNQHQFALIYLDLDLFKEVNDNLGHDVGDLLLKEVAKRLTSHVRENDICARLGGDEFVVILTQVKEPFQAEEKLSRLLAHLAAPYHLSGHEIIISASAGISFYPLDHSEGEELIKQADTALRRAKETGRNKYCRHEIS